MSNTAETEQSIHGINRYTAHNVYKSIYIYDCATATCVAEAILQPKPASQYALEEPRQTVPCRDGGIGVLKQSLQIEVEGSRGSSQAELEEADIKETKRQRPKGMSTKWQTGLYLRLRLQWQPAAIIQLYTSYQLAHSSYPHPHHDHCHWWPFRQPIS